MTTAAPKPPGTERLRMDACTEVRFPAQVSEVRKGLAALMASPALCDLGPEDRGTAELLLAEALNNVVEHAYARWGGEVAVTLDAREDRVQVAITDQGLPMPGAVPPSGALPEVGAIEDLPEGGFGWFLIRSLAQDLTYRRIGDSNELRFCFPVNNWDQASGIDAWS